MRAALSSPQAKVDPVSFEANDSVADELVTEPLGPPVIAVSGGVASGPGGGGRTSPVRIFSRRTNLKFWFPEPPGVVLVSSWQTNRPDGKAEPKLAATAAMPSVREQPSAVGPATMRKAPR